MEEVPEFLTLEGDNLEELLKAPAESVGDKVKIQIVENKAQINILSQEQEAKKEELLFGDLTPEQRKVRRAQEQHWIAPKRVDSTRVQGFQSLLTRSLPHPLFCYPLGLTKAHAFALRCMRNFERVTNEFYVYPMNRDASGDETAMFQEEQRFFLHEDASLRKCSEFNEILALKHHARQVERYAFERNNLAYFAGCAGTTEHREQFHKEWDLECRRDPTFSISVSLLKAESNKAELESNPQWMEMPGMRPMVRTDISTFERLEWNNYLGSITCDQKNVTITEYTIDMMTLSAPTVRKYERERQRPKWKDFGIVIRSLRGSTPVVCLDDNCIGVVYENFENNFVLDLYNVTSPPKKTQSIAWSLPSQPDLPAAAMACSHMDGSMVALGIGAYIVVPTHQSIFELTCSSKKRWVSCVRAVPEQNMVVVGTSDGEIFGLNLSGEKKYAFSRCVAVTEPIFNAYIHNSQLIIQLATGIVTQSLEESEREYFKRVPRPVATGACGSLVFMLNKSGAITVAAALADMTYRVPTQRLDKHVYTPIGVVSYQGMTVYPDRIVCMLPNGVVRTVFQTLYMMPEGQKHDDEKDSTAN